MPFESRYRPLLPRRQFLRRQIEHAVGGFGFLFAFLLAGIFGYHFLAGFSWIDSFLNASMILGGMGPVDPLPSAGAKIFAGLYALVSGVGFLVIVGIIVAPLVHRLLHRFHLEASAPKDDR